MGLKHRLAALTADAAPAPWERPSPPAGAYRRDALGAVVVFVLGTWGWWLATQFSVEEMSDNSWQSVVSIAAICAPLATRRRWPLASLLVSTAVFLIAGSLLPTIAIQATFQVAAFASLYAAAAWAKDTRAYWICAAVVLASVVAWLVISFALSISAERMLFNLPEQRGPVPPLGALALYQLGMNLAFYGGSIYMGRRARTSAWQRERLIEQAAQLEAQSAELARRAVVDERLRIARELHDVVAHHISAVGVQASAAKRIQTKDPEMTARLLTQIEHSSRRAIAETRSLLGVLRTEDPSASASDRSPEPGLTQLADLVDSAADAGLAVSLTRVVDDAVPLESVPPSLALSLYRVAQEALSNVSRHSSASSATLVVRTGRSAEAPWAEVEVVDSGRPLPGTSGTGFGVRGMRERAALHRGDVEVGPRPHGGWRVRLRVPLDSPGDDPSPSPTDSLPEITAPAAKDTP